MATGSGIEWTEATWNPTTGCTKISPGCKNCYAEAMSARLKGMGQPKYSRGFEYAEHASELSRPGSWKKPRRIFVNSMSDLFHEDSDHGFTAKCFAAMLEADWHDYQILTKRPGRMAEFSDMFYGYYGGDIPAHIWMGTSIEDGEYVHRLDQLRKVRCTTRFVSFEPLLGPVGDVDLGGIDWAIIGGESGPRHRPMEPEWAGDLIARCKEYGVPVFFKQWGGTRPKSGGRTINGKEYSEYPVIKRYNPLKGAGFDGDGFADACSRRTARGVARSR